MRFRGRHNAATGSNGLLHMRHGVSDAGSVADAAVGVQVQGLPSNGGTVHSVQTWLLQYCKVRGARSFHDKHYSPRPQWVWSS